MKAWFSPGALSASEASLVSPHFVSPLIDMTVMLMQSYPEHTPIVKGYVSPSPIDMHPIQLGVEEVVTPVKYMVNPTLLLECDASFNHFVIISGIVPSEQDRVLLFLQVLENFPLIGMVLLGIQCLHQCPFH